MSIRTSSPTIAATTGLDPEVARRVVEDVLAFHAEPVADYVRRRHAQLKTYGARNPEIFARISRGAGPPRGGGSRAQRAPAAATRLRLTEPGSRCDGASRNPVRRKEADTDVRIVGTIGAQQAAPDTADQGLARPERSGCDSAQELAVLSQQRPEDRRGAPGEVHRPGRHAAETLRRQGQRRADPMRNPSCRKWSLIAHPRRDRRKIMMAIVHDGIIDNAAALRAPARRGRRIKLFPFVDERDAEVHRPPGGPLEEGRRARGQATTRRYSAIEGAFALAVLHADFPDRIVVAGATADP